MSQDEFIWTIATNLVTRQMHQGGAIEIPELQVAITAQEVDLSGRAAVTNAGTFLL